MLNRVLMGCVCSAAAGLLPGSVMAADERPLSLSVGPTILADASGEAASVAAGTTFRFRGFGLYSMASGKFDFKNTIPGVPSEIDLKDTLGMDMNHFTAGGMAELDFGKDKQWHLGASFNGYTPYSGSKDVGSIVFNGNLFVGVVDSKLHVYEGEVSLNYDIWRSPQHDLTFNIGADFHLFYADAQLTQVLLTKTESYQLWVPIPAPSVALRWDITPHIFARGGADGLWVGDPGSFGDFFAEMGYDFSRNVGVFVGYRYWLLHVSYNDDTFDFNNGAIYAGAEFRI